MIAISSTNLLSLTGHQDSVSGNYINNATVSAAIRNELETLFTVSLAYVSASNGNYRGTLTATDSATLNEHYSYTIEYVATSSYGVFTDRQQEIAGYL